MTMADFRIGFAWIRGEEIRVFSGRDAGNFSKREPRNSTAESVKPRFVLAAQHDAMRASR